MLIPAIYRLAKQAEGKFFKPLYAVFLSFCVFCAMFTPTLYATSSEGPDRCKNVMRVVLYLLVFFNLLNGCGWAWQLKQPGQRKQSEQLPQSRPGFFYRLLELLILNKGQVMTRSVILQKIWDCDENFVDENTLSVHIRRLRQKLEPDPKNPIYVITVFGIGYTFGE